MKEYEARQFKVCYMNSPEKAQENLCFFQLFVL
ncbi:hypothetical protein THMA_1021 [Thermotoga maritima MSB8]|jgi:hypothetical protein|uniref:Uncharacterized protein n=1 Tax=Thermotoga maritima (strain ATCC 43589 / DSM 3109 / JCM 10099 / NBRC 100826 / MSB8) TaxID=243274 RepID=Q9X094_THEMA|nr:hypothetical protein TM_0999 [Thermotoga maritima MSB8]AJG41637.1 hypothetical protein TRQ7_09316 [Thermotoga sp. RQ7]AKE26911.1 hypothetical protein THMC_1021 [Thermotoga maritima]AGL49928.1 hypothetical protein Tmari_1003 [Thermotoga maritima MSB8]AKE28776.1 hypothetical protein THMA_1021 [Thermotoga maritima MSB8]